jgi:hypothetical protein
MITNRFKVIIIFLFLISAKCYSSLPRWTCFPTSIYLSNGDSLKGCVLLYEIDENNLLYIHDYIGFCSSVDYINSKVDTQHWGKKNRVIYTSDIESDSLIKWIKIKDINSVKVFGDEQRKFSIDYINLDHNKILWKIMRKSDSAFICNDLIFPIEVDFGAVRRIQLVTPTERIDIYSFKGWYIYTRIDNLIVKFINKRYNKTFKKEDFKNINSMFDYILENK